MNHPDVDEIYRTLQPEDVLRVVEEPAKASLIRLNPMV
jgi:hypothetical protein